MATTEADVAPDEIEEAAFEVESETTEPLAIVPHVDYVPRPALSAEELIARREELEHMIETSLTVDVDYGVIPGTKKPSLWKPGAEKIAFWFGWEITFPLERQRRVEDIAEGFFFYTYTCVLIDKATVREIGECEGSANSKEKRFAKYTSGDDRNPFDQVNPLMKMGQKRAMVGAILFAAALSNRFTQDVEDMDITGGEPFGLDIVVSFGKHSGTTWRQLVKDHPDYVIWAIGRGNGDGVDRLDDEAKQVLGNYLDSLADVTDAVEETKKAGFEGDAWALNNTDCPLTKHKGEKWANVLLEDPDYCRWCVDNGKVQGRVLRALEAALAPEATEKPADDAPFDLDTARAKYGEGRWEDLYVHLCQEWEIQPEGEEAYAAVHPDQPTKFNEWKEANYKKACREFHRHGTRTVIEKAVAVQEQRERSVDPPEEPIVDTETEDLLKSVSKRALDLGLIRAEDSLEARECFESGDTERVRWFIKKWQQMVFTKLGSSSG